MLHNILELTLEDQPKNKPKNDSNTPLKRIDLQFCFVDMGASEYDIPKKLERQFKKKYPEIEIKVTANFYASDSTLQEIEKRKNKNLPSKVMTDERLNKARISLDELKKKFPGKEEKDYVGLKEALLKLSKLKVKSMFYHYHNNLDSDVILLKAFQRNDKNPYQLISEIQEPQQSNDESCIVIKFLFAQTSECAKYSLSTRKTIPEDTVKKFDSIEEEYLNSFAHALATFKPNIVICENVSNVQNKGKALIDKLRKLLTDAKLEVKPQKIAHSIATATRRERHYVIGCDFQFDTTNKLLSHPQRIPHKYLFHANSQTEEKYESIKKLENFGKVIQTVRETEVAMENARFFVAGAEKFVDLLRLAILFKQQHTKKLILLPSKIETVFPRQNGEKRNNTAFKKGLIIQFNRLNGVISFAIYDKTRPCGRTLPKIVFAHSHYPLATLTSTNEFYFWNLKGHHPSIGELALIQGMTKSYAEGLVNYENGITRAAAQKTLSHNLCPKVVAPLLMTLVEQKLAGRLPASTEEKKLSVNEDIRQKFKQDLQNGIELDRYRLIAVQIKNSEHSIYFIADENGIIDEGLILSDVYLPQLHELGVIKDGRLNIEIPKILNDDKTNLRLKNHDQIIEDCEDDDEEDECQLSNEDDDDVTPMDIENKKQKRKSKEEIEPVASNKTKKQTQNPARLFPEKKKTEEKESFGVRKHVFNF